MRANRLTRLRGAAAVAVTALVGLLAFGPAQASQAATYVPLNGYGSTYAYPALNQWATDLEPQGLHINYNPDGSAQGRAEYAENLADYAGSDIAYISSADPDPFAGVDSSSGQFAYSYIPDVAGGLSFMYNLQVGGKKITNMRLSGQTLAEIFTGHIKNWDDPAITHDYGQRLPSTPITVVTRSDGAGESYFLTNWMDQQYRSLWVNFCVAHGGPPGCGTGPTENFPGNSAGFKSLSGSDTLSSYIASSSNNGAIGYAEEAYAIEYHLPTVNMLNAAGYYVGPTASNVAIALEHATIDEKQSDVKFLMQNLNGVYSNKDPRTYPLSSYSYLVVPRNSRTIGGHTWGPQPEFNKSKGASLSTYVNYILCGAQASAANLGYSPLPGPMVNGGFLQESQIPGAVKSPDQGGHYSNCQNPAYLNGVDLVTKQAPYPNACQKAGAPLNCKVVGGRAVSTGGSGGSGGAGSSGAGASTGAGGTAGPGGKAGSTAASGAASSNAKVNPNTGQIESGANPAADTNLTAVSTGIAGSPAQQWAFGILAALLLLAAIAIPSGLGAWLAEAGGRRPRGGNGPQSPFLGPRPPVNGPPPPAPGSPPSTASSPPPAPGSGSAEPSPPAPDGGPRT